MFSTIPCSPLGGGIILRRIDIYYYTNSTCLSREITPPEVGMSHARNLRGKGGRQDILSRLVVCGLLGWLGGIGLLRRLGGCIRWAGWLGTGMEWR